MTSMQRTWALEKVKYWLNLRDRHNLPEISNLDQDILSILRLILEQP